MGFPSDHTVRELVLWLRSDRNQEIVHPFGWQIKLKFGAGEWDVRDSGTCCYALALPKKLDGRQSSPLGNTIVAQHVSAG